MRQLVSAGPQTCLPAVAFATPRCKLPPALVPAPGRVELRVDTAAVLTLAFLNCGDPLVVAAGVDYQLLNPGGQNLGTEQAPLPLTFILFTALWLALLLAALANLRRRGDWSVLQAALLSVPALKTAHMAVAAAKWTSLSITGVKIEPLDVTLIVALTCSQVDLLGMLLLLSRGWLITRTALAPPERNSLALSLALLASLYFVYHLWSPRSFFALAVAYICVLGFSFTSVGQGLRHLRAQEQLLRVSGSEVEDVAAWTRVRIFAGFHGALFCFTCVEVVLHLVDLFLPPNWLHALFSEVADFALVLAVGWLFRPRQPSPFVCNDTEEMLREAAGNIIAGRGRGVPRSPTDEEMSRAIAQLQARQQAPHAAPPLPQEDDVVPLPVLVENPCTYDSQGRRVMSVGVGLPHSPAAASDVDGATRASDMLRLALHGGDAALFGGGGSQGRRLALELSMTHNPLVEGRLTQTQPDERDAGMSAADRFRARWGAPGFLPSDQRPPQTNG